jgi:predicted nucleotidyltransferase
MVSSARIEEYKAVIERIANWAPSRPDIVAVGVVGSWARGVPRRDSDVDIIVLTTERRAYLDTDEWIEASLGEPLPVVRRAEWGTLTERRLRMPSGFEVEMGFVAPSWARTNPVDPGTATVVGNGGLLPVYDPQGLLAALATVV